MSKEKNLVRLSLFRSTPCTKDAYHDNEVYYGPAIDRLYEFEKLGMEPEEIEQKLKCRENLVAAKFKDEIDRLKNENEKLRATCMDLNAYNSRLCIENADLRRSKVHVDVYYNLVREKYGKLDAIYEDIIVSYIGRAGMDALRENGLIECCGTVYGRKLYTLLDKEK